MGFQGFSPKSEYNTDILTNGSLQDSYTQGSDSSYDINISDNSQTFTFTIYNVRTFQASGGTSGGIVENPDPPDFGNSSNAPSSAEIKFTMRDHQGSSSYDYTISYNADNVSSGSVTLTNNNSGPVSTPWLDMGSYSTGVSSNGSYNGLSSVKLQVQVRLTISSGYNVDGVTKS